MSGVPAAAQTVGDPVYAGEGPGNTDCSHTSPALAPSATKIICSSPRPSSVPPRNGSAGLVVLLEAVV